MTKDKGKMRQVRERMQETGETYQQALQALGLEQRTVRLMLPPDGPYTGPNQCPQCAGGRYRTDFAATLPGDPGRPVLVCQVFCPRCLGCGRAEHEQCTASEHADPEGVGLYPAGWDDDEDEDDVDDAEPCYSCRGRTWWPMQAFDEQDVFYVRAPCGCSTPLLVPAAEVA